MPTSDASWPGRLRIIGDLERPDHWHLQPDDDDAFFGEYTPREGWRYSSTNQLILNLEKRPNVARGTFQWPHKLQAIQDIAAAIRANLTPDALATSVFAPMRVRIAGGPPQHIHDLGAQHLPGGEIWVVGEHRSTGERKYYLSNLLADTPLAQLAGAIKAR